MRAHLAWSSDPSDTFGRVYAVGEVARGFLALHAVAVNLFIVAPRATSPAGVWAASIVLVCWQVFISLRMRKPAGRTKPAFVADLLVTVAIILTTVVTVPPGGAPLSLAGYWAGGCAAYAAVFLNHRWGISFALTTSAALLVAPQHFAMERVGAAFITILFTVCLTILVRQFRVALEEQEQARLRSAALAERERLSRIVHDGALQVLALVEREGPSLGPRGERLAALARESEAQLRIHLQDREVGEVEETETVNLVTALDKYESARVTVSTMASHVEAPRSLVDEVECALVEILKNVEKHAGPAAQVWILLDQERDDEVILWVRDNGAGMSAAQVQEAADSGRLGIRDSIVGRLNDLGGSAILKSSPGAGAEWELRFPIEVDEEGTDAGA